MYRSLLVPLDGSSFAEQALPLAVEICARSGASLHLVLVHDSLAAVPRFGEPVFLDQSLDLASRRQEEEYLEAVARPLIGRGIVVVTRLIDGPVAHSLVNYTRASAIELVVLTTHGRGVFSRFWIGSVADRLVRQLEVPMLLLRPHAARGAPPASMLRRILIPLDGSPLAEAVLEPATQLGDMLGAEYTLFRAVVLPPPLQLPYPAVMIIPEQTPVTSVLREQAQGYLDEMAHRLRSRGLRVETAVEVTTDSVSAISTWAERHGADLIALATHGYGGATRFLLGSVADKLVRSATVPIFVWRPTAPADHAAQDSSRTGALAAAP
jgi:nucleotide-binding universal stress UspA family protein